MSNTLSAAQSSGLERRHHPHGLVVLFHAEDGYGVTTSAEFDGDPASVVRDDPFMP